MFVHYRTFGLVLKKKDRGENDQLFTFYTKDFGKLEILGKAIRKISSKLHFGADIFYLSEIEFIQGKANKTLTDAVLIDKLKNLRNDLKRLAIAYKISETLDELVEGEEKDEKIWYLALETFDKLDSFFLSSDNYFLVYYFFLWNLFSILGYTPEVYCCSVCQKRIAPGGLSFSASEGGVICNLCSRGNKKSKMVGDEFIKILRIILKGDWATLSKLKFDELQKKLLKDISSYYLSFIKEQN